MKIYLLACLFWGIYAGYKQRTTYPIPFNCWENCIKTGIINFLILPIAFFYFLKKKKYIKKI